ncbi:hypothetical protein SAMN06265353_1695 [Hydrogenobacter hydrogenophilus]|uniref:Uncharacterized protein n=1 Tax=Hydrogenobacter hydrogenophilus TaxID=35835 RepID=A0A285P4U8_9AQUI|nr:hypothetical protein SAMN06265353_1695 [Hydrogenobacter hydrogenophilus]
MKNPDARSPKAKPTPTKIFKNACLMPVSVFFKSQTVEHGDGEVEPPPAPPEGGEGAKGSDG